MIISTIQQELAILHKYIAEVGELISRFCWNYEFARILLVALVLCCRMVFYVELCIVLQGIAGLFR